MKAKQCVLKSEQFSSVTTPCNGLLSVLGLVVVVGFFFPDLGLCFAFAARCCVGMCSIPWL